MIKDKYVLGSRNDPGDPRRNNEDRVWVGEILRKDGDSLIVGIVADGVGSAEGAAGAQLAVDTTRHFVEESSGNDIPQILANAIEAANLAVFRDNERLDRNGLTTLVVSIIHNERCFIGNVGDSRAYWVQSGGKGSSKMLQLTRDHSYYNIYGGVDPNSQEGGVLVNYIGKKTDVFVDIGFYLKGPDREQAHQLGVNGLPLKPGDSILLCSDGLIKTDRLGKRYAEDGEIASALVTESETDKAAVKIVSAAVGRRPDDNVSAVTIQYLSHDVMQEIATNRRRELTNARIKQVYPVVGIVSALAIVIAVVSVLLKIGNPPAIVAPTYTPYPTFAVPNSIFVGSSNAGSIGRLVSVDGNMQELVAGMQTVSEGSRVEVTQQVANINLADGTALYISNGTVFTFKKFGDGTVISLEQGSIMAKLGPAAKSLIIETVDGYSAQVSGSVMGVQYISVPPGPGVYVDCYEGHCSVLGGNIALQGMEGDDRFTFFAPSGATRSDTSARCQYWKDILSNETAASLGITCIVGTATPSPVPTKDQSIRPTQRDRDDGNPSVATPRP